MSEIGIDDNLFDDITEENEMTENVEHSGKRMMQFIITRYYC